MVFGHGELRDDPAEEGEGASSHCVARMVGPDPGSALAAVRESLAIALPPENWTV